ncbi:hypothetical protein BCR33DRAFT_762489, partial [Rhizoclosmatium globosum]
MDDNEPEGDDTTQKPTKPSPAVANLRSRLGLKELDSKTGTTSTKASNGTGAGTQMVIDLTIPVENADDMEVDVSPSSSTKLSSVQTERVDGSTQTTMDSGAQVTGQSVSGIVNAKSNVDGIMDLVTKVNVGSQLDSNNGAFLTTKEGMLYGKAPFKVWHPVAERIEGGEYKMLGPEAVRKPVRFSEAVSPADKKLLNKLLVESLKTKPKEKAEDNTPTINELKTDLDNVNKKIDRKAHSDATGPGVNMDEMGTQLKKHNSQLNGAEESSAAVSQAAEEDNATATTK